MDKYAVAIGATVLAMTALMVSGAVTAVMLGIMGWYWLIPAVVVLLKIFEQISLLEDGTNTRCQKTKHSYMED